MLVFAATRTIAANEVGGPVSHLSLISDWGVCMRVGIIDLLGKEPPTNPYSRFMRSNNTSVMPQVVGVWCEELGHQVSMAYYSGAALLAGGLPDDIDILFINSYSQTALVAYAMSAKAQSQGTVTVLGGPHARSYPEDARQYFDYVVGFCDKPLIEDILRDCSPSRPVGQCLSARSQPDHLPGLTRRWKFLEPAMASAKLLRAVPMLGSVGCPYTCSFCIDARISYQPLDFDELKADLRFFTELKLPRAIVVWHDPTSGSASTSISTPLKKPFRRARSTRSRKALSRSSMNHTPDFWMNLQQRWDLYHARAEKASELERISGIRAAG